MAETATTTKRVRKTKTAPAKKTGITLSAKHKEALAAGRETGRAVERYLDALAEANKPKPRGRQRTLQQVTNELNDTVAKLADNGASSLTRIKLIQKKMDLEAELIARQVKTPAADIAKLEAAFVKVAKNYSESKGITHGAWRHYGVPAITLRKAGITR